MTVDFNFWPLRQGHNFFKLKLYKYYMAQFLAKLFKSFKIYGKIKYLTLDFDLLPLDQGHIIVISFL